MQALPALSKLFSRHHQPIGPRHQCGQGGVFADGCKDFAELRALIVQARATAMNDADRRPPPRPPVDIKSDELIMA